MFRENSTTELKVTLNEKFEKEAIAFLNSKEGGDIYIGVNNQGVPVGLDNIDELQLKIADRIKNNISPATLGLFDVLLEKHEGKEIIHVVVASGPEKPYYYSKAGLTPNGCYIRVGSGNQQMTQKMIDELLARRIRNSLRNICSPKNNLTFEQLQIYYQAKDLTLNDKFADNLELLTEDGKFNYIGYLLSDNNGISIKVAKYSGKDKTDLIENEEYGYCSLIKAAKSVLDKLEIENKTLTKITNKERIERKLIEPIALREAVINAFVHNDYSSEVPPVFEIFSDRLQITSYGGLVNGLSEEDFFGCRSMSRNRELMRIFKDLGLVEQLGSGMSRILKAYDKSIFEITPNFLVVTFPFYESQPLKKNDKIVFDIVKEYGSLKRKEIEKISGLSSSTVIRITQKLTDMQLVEQKTDKSGRVVITVK